MYEWLRRLEPLPPFGDLQRGFAQEVADPLWMLARQWQLGEHLGEDAGTPVGVTIPATHTRIDPVDGLDPTIVPAEAIVEGTAEDWWTPGRRVRVGQAVASGLSESQRNEARFIDPLPAPYGSAFRDQVDGRAAWRKGFVPSGHPALKGFIPGIKDNWRASTLDHAAAFKIGATTLTLPAHSGGDVDWYSCDADAPLPAPTSVRAGAREIIPTRLHYPGAPLPRIWQIEDRATDIGGYPPDRSHLATVLLIQLIADHANDWFLVPIPVPNRPAGEPKPPGIGVVVTLGTVTVRNSFDEDDTVVAPPGAADPPPQPDEPVGPWSLFRTQGLDRSSLVLWPTAASPLTGPLLDDAILGVDEDADVIWAVELVADGVALAADAESSAALADGRRTGTQKFTWIPSTTLPEHWHPYRVEPREGRRIFVQGRVADLTTAPPALRRGPRSSLIGGSADADPASPSSTGGIGHELEMTAVPYQGVRLERRYVLARGTDGRPVLWRQRRRVPVLAGPTSHLRFDVFREEHG
jgi:hypothetical protein